MVVCTDKRGVVFGYTDNVEARPIVLNNARVRAKHLGLYPKPKRKLQGRGFAPSRQFQGAKAP